MSWLQHLRPDTSVCVLIWLALAHFLWQGTAVAAVVWLAEPLLKRRSAAFSYNVLFVALLVLALCPVANLIVISHWGLPIATVRAALNPTAESASETFGRTDRTDIPVGGRVRSVPSAVAQTPEDFVPTDHLGRAATWAVAAYLGGVSVMLGRLVLAVGAGRSLRRTRIEPGLELRETFGRIAGRMRLRHVPALGFCARIATPAVVGILRPVVLLPVSAVSELSVSQIEAVLAHELAHVRRLDVVTNMFQRVVEVFLFFHPAVWFISGRVRVERENCCDDVVLLQGASPTDYAGALIRIAETSLPVPMGALAAVGAGSRLRRRVLRIIGSEIHELDLPRAGTAVAASMAVIATLAIGMGVTSGLARAQTAKTAPASQLSVSPGGSAAVARGLEWLARRIGPDGRIAGTQLSTQANVAIPSFVGLALLASGSTSENGTYAGQIRAIEKHVLESQDASGLLASKAGPQMYEHGYAVLFLAESQMKHPDAAIRTALVKAVELTEKAVNNEGGWRYSPRPLDADISVTACQLNALLAAKAAGIEVNQKVIDGAITFVRKCQNPDGGFAYMACSTVTRVLEISAQQGFCNRKTTASSPMKWVPECSESVVWPRLEKQQFLLEHPQSTIARQQND